MSRRWVRTSKEAITDALTGLGNRRKLDRRPLPRLPLATPERTARDPPLRPQRVQALQRRLRPSRRRRAAGAGFGTSSRRRGRTRRQLRTGSAETSSASVAPLGAEAIAHGGNDAARARRSRRRLRRRLLPTVRWSLPTTLKAADDALRARGSAALRQPSRAAARSPAARPPTCSSRLCASANPSSTTTCTASAISPRASASGSDSPSRSSTSSARQPSCTTSARSRSPTRFSPSPDALDSDEWAVRPPAPARSASGSSLRLLRWRRSRKLVRASHERFDGTGYPDGKAGDEIPLGARIIAVCDAYDAMIGPRPYRLGMSEEVALTELRRCAGDAVRSRDRRRLLRAARAEVFSLDGSRAIATDRHDEDAQAAR